MNLTGPITLFTAPPGTSPFDGDDWQPIGQIDNATIVSEPSPDLMPFSDWSTAATVLLNFRATRFFFPRPQCEGTRSAINRHFLRQHIDGLLLAARQRPALLPCPLPY
ncbi:hypothetical protein [Streptomyces microflavus]|uniref:hypothetical protein n=1 Tax=Streptomyces microflavus TaxID=1919 RepID=UPI0036520182